MYEYKIIQMGIDGSRVLRLKRFRLLLRNADC